MHAGDGFPTFDAADGAVLGPLENTGLGRKLHRAIKQEDQQIFVKEGGTLIYEKAHRVGITDRREFGLYSKGRIRRVHNIPVLNGPKAEIPRESQALINQYSIGKHAEAMTSSRQADIGTHVEKTGLKELGKKLLGKIKPPDHGQRNGK